MSPKSFQLIVRAGPNPGKIYPIMKSEVVIGRDPNSDVLINDAEVSRHHATIKKIPEGYTIEDVGSTNGTIINGQRITGAHLLREGEMINLGEHIALIYEAQQAFDPDATLMSARMSMATRAPSETSSESASEPKSHQPPFTPSVPSEQIQGSQTAFQDDSGFMSQIESKPKTKIPRWLIYVIIGAIALTLLCIIGILIYIDTNYLWCKVLPFLNACQTPPSSWISTLALAG